MRPKAAVLTDHELQIMKIIWDRGEATVRDVYEALREQRKIAYTTVMTVVGVLEEKGHLCKRHGDRAYIYAPAQPRQNVLNTMIRQFVDRVLDGSAKPLLQHLVEDRLLSAEDIDELSRLLAKREKKS